jgi:hypothetical protein
MPMHTLPNLASPHEQGSRAIISGRGTGDRLRQQLLLADTVGGGAGEMGQSDSLALSRRPDVPAGPLRAATDAMDLSEKIGPP